LSNNLEKRLRRALRKLPIEQGYAETAALIQEYPGRRYVTDDELKERLTKTCRRAVLLKAASKICRESGDFSG